MIRECMILLPGHGLEDFPRSLPTEQADQTLAGWVALWHPQLIAATGSAPHWQSATYPPTDDPKSLVFTLPENSQSFLPDSWHEQMTEKGALILPAKSPWKSLQAELLQRLGLDNDNHVINQLVDDFAALGYAYLQIQLMTRQLRYTSNLDELLFNDQLAQSARAALAEDAETAERMLQSCFDQLGQERDHYYSLEVNLIDITLLAPTTLGNSLARQFDNTDANASGKSTAILASASLLKLLKDQFPDNFARLKTALDERQACIIGGLDSENPHPLMHLESLRRDLARGRQAYEALGIAFPSVFGRYTYGMIPDMPLLMRRNGFQGGLLVAWEQGVYPQGNQAKISWEASEGTYLPTLAPQRVLDAADPASYLTFGWKAGEALDHEQSPAILFAHWPGRTCDYNLLLRRVSKRTPALGKWVLVDDFFTNTDQPYHQDRLSPSQFRFDWLSDGGTPARTIMAQSEVYQRCFARATSIQNLANLLHQLEHLRETVKWPTTDASTAESQPITYRAAQLSQWSPEADFLWSMIDDLYTSQDPHLVEQQIHQSIDAWEASLAPQIAKNLVGNCLPADTTGHPENLRLVLNPYSCPMRLTVATAPNVALGQDCPWIQSAGPAGNRRLTMVDVPPLGFATLPTGTVPTALGRTRQATLAESDGLLRNEFLEAQIDMKRGHLRSLHIPGKRGNRLSCSLAFRCKEEQLFRYSDMQADRVELVEATSMLGRYRAIGAIVQDNQRVGRFDLVYSLWRGSRILEIELQLSELQKLQGSPWHQAFVLRFAWPTEAAILRSFAAGMRESIASGPTIAPQVIEIDEADYRTHLLMGGLVFHRRVESRFLETIVAVQDQSSASVRFGVAVDLPHPVQSAAQFLDQVHQIPIHVSSPKQNTGWLFSIDSKNAKMDLECPLFDLQGSTVGQRFRLAETAGKTANATIRCPREVFEAYRVDDQGNRYGKLSASGDQFVIVLRSQERVFVDVLWK